jgi:hypothetical protein
MTVMKLGAISLVLRSARVEVFRTAQYCGASGRDADLRNRIVALAHGIVAMAPG